MVEEDAEAATEELLGAALRLTQLHGSVAVKVARAGAYAALVPILGAAALAAWRTEAATALAVMCGANVAGAAAEAAARADLTVGSLAADVVRMLARDAAASEHAEEVQAAAALTAVAAADTVLGLGNRGAAATMGVVTALMVHMYTAHAMAATSARIALLALCDGVALRNVAADTSAASTRATAHVPEEADGPTMLAVQRRALRTRAPAELAAALAALTATPPTLRSVGGPLAVRRVAAAAEQLVLDCVAYDVAGGHDDTLAQGGGCVPSAKNELAQSLV